MSRARAGSGRPRARSQPAPLRAPGAEQALPRPGRAVCCRDRAPRRGGPEGAAAPPALQASVRKRPAVRTRAHRAAARAKPDAPPAPPPYLRRDVPTAASPAEGRPGLSARAPSARAEGGAPAGRAPDAGAHRAAVPSAQAALLEGDRAGALAHLPARRVQTGALLEEPLLPQRRLRHQAGQAVLPGLRAAGLQQAADLLGGGDPVVPGG